MAQFETIISKEIKRDRNTLYNRNKRRKQGVQKREDYLQERKKQIDNNLEKVKQYLKEGLKQKEIAAKLGLSKGRISQMVKELKKV